MYFELQYNLTMKKIKLALSVMVIVSGILVVLFSPLITKMVYSTISQDYYNYYGRWLTYLLPTITNRLVTLGSVLIVVGVIYILFRKE